MSTQTAATPPTLEADATSVPQPLTTMVAISPGQMIMDEPPKGHVYLAIPSDIPAWAIQSEGIQGLCRIAGGELVAQLSEDLPALMMAVLTLGRKGKLKMTLEVAPDGQRRVAIGWDVTSTPPKEKRHPSVLFSTPSGQLVTRDPDQLEMELKTAPAPAAQPVRTVAPPPQAAVRTVAPPSHHTQPVPLPQSSPGVSPVPAPVTPPGTVYQAPGTPPSTTGSPPHQQAAA